MDATMGIIGLITVDVEPAIRVLPQAVNSYLGMCQRFEMKSRISSNRNHALRHRHSGRCSKVAIIKFAQAIDVEVQAELSLPAIARTN